MNKKLSHIHIYTSNTVFRCHSLDVQVFETMLSQRHHHLCHLYYPCFIAALHSLSFSISYGTCLPTFPFQPIHQTHKRQSLTKSCMAFAIVFIVRGAQNLLRFTQFSLQLCRLRQSFFRIFFARRRKKKQHRVCLCKSIQ